MSDQTPDLPEGALNCGAVGVVKYVDADGQIGYREFWSADLAAAEVYGMSMGLTDTIRDLLMGSMRPTE